MKSKIIPNKILAGVVLTITSHVNAGVMYDDSVIPSTMDNTPQYTETVDTDTASTSEVVVDLRYDEAAVSEVEKEDVSAIQEEIDTLEQAKEELRKAEAERQLAEQNRQKAADEATRAANERIAIADEQIRIKKREAQLQLAKRTLDPQLVLNEQISARFEGATIKEIVTAIMPAGWTVTVDIIKKPEIKEKRFYFRSTDRRNTALRTLFASIREVPIRYQFFWDLVDENGNPAPEIIVTDARPR